MFGMRPTAQAGGLEDAFVKISFENERLRASKDGDSNAYNGWFDKATSAFSRPNLVAADLFRKLYPNHSLVMTQDYNLNLLGFPGALSIPLKPDELITNSIYAPVGRNNGGFLVDAVEFGCFKTAWDKYEFTIYIVKYVEGFGNYTQHYILHEGSEAPSRDLLRAAGDWFYQLHEEIWVFNNGFWNKDHGLWTEVQKADWKDVILDETFKKALQKDVYSFFDSEALYKELGIPWKRGLIMYGPPGNGKTISLKAIMKTVQQKGYNPLYVKTFQSWRGEEGSMQEVFGKARILAPCVLILEDLDSLINDRNRSFFLNQLDGIEGNDGLLLIGTTNHFDRLDPGLSSRPSRFDRKYEFLDPSRSERLQYCQYWQGKLKNNKEVNFPDELANEIADETAGFSFAYLKEAFVSTLVLFASDENEQTFEEIIKEQIKKLRKQLDKPELSVASRFYTNKNLGHATVQPDPPKPDVWEVARSRAVQLAASLGQPGRVFTY